MDNKQDAVASIEGAVATFSAGKVKIETHVVTVAIEAAKEMQEVDREVIVEVKAFLKPINDIDDLKWLSNKANDPSKYGWTHGHKPLVRKMAKTKMWWTIAKNAGALGSRAIAALKGLDWLLGD